MRIAFITDAIPRPNRAGYLAYNHALITHLAGRGHQVSVVLAYPRLTRLVERFDAFLDPDRVQVVGPGLSAGHGTVRPQGLRRGARVLARGMLELLPGGLGETLRRAGRADRYGDVDAVIGRFLTAREARESARLADGADLVMADAIFRAPALDHLRPGVRRAIVTHDVFSQRHAALAARGLSLHPSSLSEAEEAGWLARARLLVAIQEEEEAVLRRLAPEASIVTAPMPASAVPRPPGTVRDPRRIVFVGSAGPHNADGMRWFLDKIWPSLLARLPGVRLDICGAVGRVLHPLPDGVAALGIVPDLAPVLHRAGLAVAPLLAGSGLKIKMLDYAAHGLVTVTTPIGAAGFERTADWPFVLADTPAAFAEAVAGLAAGDAAAREARCHAYLHRYDADRLLAPFVAMVEDTGRE